MKIATFLSTMKSIASDFRPLIIDISKIYSALRYQLWSSFSQLLFNENASFLEFEFRLTSSTLEISDFYKHDHFLTL